MMRNLALLAATLLLIVGIPELLIRNLVTMPAVRPDTTDPRFVDWLAALSVPAEHPGKLYVQDRGLLWRLGQGMTIDSYNPFYELTRGERQPVRISVNQFGYRGPEVSGAGSADVVRLLCMGDSHFFGFPLDDADALPAALARSLHWREATRRIEVVNGGVPGYSVLQGWQWYRRQFERLEYSVLLLSYLNNDAWPQPRTDAEQMRRNASPLWYLEWTASRWQALVWARSLLGQRFSADRPRVPRVTLQDFVGTYRRFITAAREKGARVVILDFRAYDAYQPYSQALRQLAIDTGTEYVVVAEALQSELVSEDQSRFADQAGRVERRWGRALLEERPYLWFYAEPVPDHLNELGAAWLAEALAQRLFPD